MGSNSSSLGRKHEPYIVHVQEFQLLNLQNKVVKQYTRFRNVLSVFSEKQCRASFNQKTLKNVQGQPDNVLILY